MRRGDPSCGARSGAIQRAGSPRRLAVFQDVVKVERRGWIHPGLGFYELEHRRVGLHEPGTTGVNPVTKDRKEAIFPKDELVMDLSDTTNQEYRDLQREVPGKRDHGQVFFKDVLPDRNEIFLVAGAAALGAHSGEELRPGGMPKLEPMA